MLENVVTANSRQRNIEVQNSWWSEVYTHAHVRKKCQLPHARNQSVRKGTRLAAPLVFFEGSLESLVLGLILKAFLYNRLTDYYNNIPIKFNQVLNSERSSLID